MSIRAAPLAAPLAAAAAAAVVVVEEEGEEEEEEVKAAMMAGQVYSPTPVACSVRRR